ncbi:CBS domain-containing protein [Flavicella sp.]|uniref:CBS domain-containing protein n=1 Tax=Flavicella sp. TaxID=2957742 RepID=UPI002626F87D|nr:CBS domain-containing protein [Flavicella sp.]MDG1803995.1 CBS domain-containing protein [Flavicella sp.]
MKLEDYISNDLPTLNFNESVLDSKLKTKDQRVSHFPVTLNNKLYGSLPESDLQTFSDDSKLISEFQYTLEAFFATEEDTILDLLTLFAVNETNILPVLNSNKEYIGFYELNDILNFYAETPFFNEDGIVLILEKDSATYSISEITQISESNNALILGLHVSFKNEKTSQVTIKIKTDIIDEIIQSYRRYEYNVISNHEDDSYLEDLKNRSNYLQRYLSI